MSEFAAPSFPGDASGDGAATMTPEKVEAVLADFRSWLQQFGAITSPPVEAEACEPIDLHTLLAQFIALRHEVNLQTKAAHQQEQNVATLEKLDQALEQLQQQQSARTADAGQGRTNALRPLLKTLVDAYDALARGEREVRACAKASLIASRRSRPISRHPRRPRRAAASWHGGLAPFRPNPVPGQPS